VTRRRTLEQHRDSLQEIGKILASMKTLAYMETRKLTQVLAAQTSMVAAIGDAVGDFLAFHRELMPEAKAGSMVYLLIGSERGFCGGFNQELVQRLAQQRADQPGTTAGVIAVGEKLRSYLTDEDADVAFLPGASVVEEAPSVLQDVANHLGARQAAGEWFSLAAIYHDGEGITVRSLLPPFDEIPEVSPEGDPPLLQVPPADLLPALIDHYLMAALNHLLYTSLMAESQRRVIHLDGAVRQLQRESEELTHTCRSLRQEEIVEEIEVILLSAASLGEATP
jgi:F-type H+-transporting ATPase subunit gamma